MEKTVDINSLMKRNPTCLVCKGQNMEGDTNVYTKKFPSGSYYEYVIICCIDCGFMRFHKVDSVVKPENLVKRTSM